MNAGVEILLINDSEIDIHMQKNEHTYTHTPFINNDLKIEQSTNTEPQIVKINSTCTHDQWFLRGT